MTRSLTSSESKRIESYKKCRSSTKDIFEIDENDPGKIVPLLTDDLSAQDAVNEFQSRIYASTGYCSQDVGIRLLTQAAHAINKATDDPRETLRLLNTIAKTIQALEPQDEIEGQLLAQLTVLHEQSMSWLGRAMRTERVDFANTYLNGASKLLARHHEVLNTLMKYRRGGEQRVHVEHVHVHGGAQAIVGNVSSGGGLNQKTEEGPHAKV